MPRQPHQHRAEPVQHRQLDEQTADALRLYGGLGDQEFPVAVVQVVETRGWDGDGREFADFQRPRNRWFHAQAGDEPAA